jgi:UDP-N-acetyl-D-glucosamine dehydrogenase
MGAPARLRPARRVQACVVSRVVVVGQGYVGLPLAMRAVSVGHDVTGIDVDEGRVKRLADGDSFVEDIAPAVVEEALSSGRFRVALDLAQETVFDVAVITVPTPLREGRPDLSAIEHAGEMLATRLQAGSLVVLESTTYPGTTDELLVPILERGSGLIAGRDFAVGYSPERIDPGNQRHTLATTPKLVSGLTANCCQLAAAFYRTMVDTVVEVSSTRIAELAKLIENTFRHVNVALVNELAMLARELGIDVWQTLDAAATKPFGFMRFMPGPGVGGHCLPIDPTYLSWAVEQRIGRPSRFVELANDINDGMPYYVVARIADALGRRGIGVADAHVLVLGLAYKRNSSDARESPAIAIIERLLAHGADVAVVDPHVVEDVATSTAARRTTLDAAELGAADLVVLVTDHDAFDYELVGAHARHLLDTRHRLDGPGVEHL